MKKSVLGIVVLGVLFVLPVNACECLKGLFSSRPAPVQQIRPAIQPVPAVPRVQAMEDQLPDAAPQVSAPVPASVVQQVFNVNVNVIHSRSGSMALSPRSVAQLPPALVSPAGSRHSSLRTPVVFMLPGAAGAESAAHGGSASRSRVTFADDSTDEADAEVAHAHAANPGAIASPSKSKLGKRPDHSIVSPGLNVRTFIEPSARAQKRVKSVSFSEAGHEGDADSDNGQGAGQSHAKSPVHQYRRLRKPDGKKTLASGHESDSDLFGAESSFSRKFPREDWGIESPEAGPIVNSPVLDALKTQKQMWQHLQRHNRQRPKGKSRFKAAALTSMFFTRCKNSIKKPIEEA